MSSRLFDRRKLLATGAIALLSACTVVPKPSGPSTPAPTPAPAGTPLPADTTRHRIALLVPTTGPNAAVGQSIANAATMALLDTDAQNLRITTYDTNGNAANAASRAVQDGNKLILGPLLSDDIPAAVKAAHPAGIPIVSFSNDEAAASRDVFVMGVLPGQSVARTISYARSRGVSTFGALAPRGDYGDRVSAAMLSSTRASGGTVVAMQPYDRSSASITAAADKLRETGGFGAVLIADGATLSARAARQLKTDGGSSPRILGTELWSGEKDVASSPSLNGAWFAAVSDTNFSRFSESYRKRFGNAPYRIATLGYDAVLLTLRVATKGWKPGQVFPARQLSEEGGFLGLDGAFRFNRDGVIERALEVREVNAGTVKVVSPAPSRFGG